MVYWKTSISNDKEHSSYIWEENIKGIEEKENSNFDSHTFQEAIIFQVPSILEGS
jgi:hypothetical protein